MSLRDAVAHDARGSVAAIAYGMSGVRKVTYQEDPLDSCGLSGCHRRKRECVTVILDADASAADAASVIDTVEDESDWAINNSFPVEDEAVLQFTREWW